MESGEDEIIKHPTLPIWGTKEGLKEYENFCKELMDKIERKLWWGNIDEKYEYVRCNCSCHKNSGVMHIAPCCENGWRRVPKAPKNEDAPNIEGIVRKSDEAPTSSSTEQDRHKWMTDKEIHEEKFRANSPHCSYCDYTPCRCSKNDK